MRTRFVSFSLSAVAALACSFILLAQTSQNSNDKKPAPPAKTQPAAAQGPVARTENSVGRTGLFWRMGTAHAAKRARIRGLFVRIA